MIRWMWDLLFTRSQWTIISTHNLDDENKSFPIGVRYVLQNQWGQIKKKECNDNTLYEIS